MRRPAGAPGPAAAVPSGPSTTPARPGPDTRTPLRIHLTLNTPNRGTVDATTRAKGDAALQPTSDAVAIIARRVSSEAGAEGTPSAHPSYFANSPLSSMPRSANRQGDDHDSSATERDESSVSSSQSSEGDGSSDHDDHDNERSTSSSSPGGYGLWPRSAHPLHLPPLPAPDLRDPWVAQPPRGLTAADLADLQTIGMDIYDEEELFANEDRVASEVESQLLSSQSSQPLSRLSGADQRSGGGSQQPPGRRPPDDHEVINIDSD